MNLATILQERARRQPDRPALITGVDGSERVVSYAQLEEISGRVATGLRARGIGRGDAVLVWVPMSVELYALLLGLFRLGAVAMLADPGAGAAALAAACRRGRPKMLAAPWYAHALRLRHPSLRRIPTHLTTSGWFPGNLTWSRLTDGEPMVGCEATSPDSPALLTFTSGSTGEPKAAMRTHGFLLAQHEAIRSAIGLGEGEVDLATLPVFVLANLASGMTSLIPAGNLRRPGHVDPAPIARQIARHRPTRGGASPAFFLRLADGGVRWPECVRLYTGGAPVYPRYFPAFAKLAPKAGVTVVYGSTEAEPISECTGESLSAADFATMRAGEGLIVGKPCENTRVRILPPQALRAAAQPTEPAEFDAMEIQAGGEGEIVVAGPQVLRGYLDGVGDEETKIRVGDTIWHRTGDCGRFDAAGRLVLLGRCSAVVATPQGTRLHPFSIEAAAMEIAGVRRAAFLSHDGRLTLVVEPDGRAPSKDQFSPLARLGVEAVAFVDRIPTDRRHNAKIEYPALRARLARTRLVPISN